LITKTKEYSYAANAKVIEKQSKMVYVPPTYHCFYVVFADTPPMPMCESELFGVCVNYSSLFLCSFQQSGIDDSYATNAMVDDKGTMGENKRKRMEQVGHLCPKAAVCNKHIVQTSQNCFSSHWKRLHAKSSSLQPLELM